MPSFGKLTALIIAAVSIIIVPAIAFTPIATTLMSNQNKEPIFRYRQKHREEEYKTKTYEIYEVQPNAAQANANARPNKVFYNVHKFDGDKDFAHLFARDTLVEFRELADEASWNQRRQFREMYRSILTGDAKDKWEQACAKGNGEDDPIDPDAPQADDIEQVYTNFFGEIGGQEFPGTIM